MWENRDGLMFDGEVRKRGEWEGRWRDSEAGGREGEGRVGGPRQWLEELSTERRGTSGVRREGARLCKREKEVLELCATKGKGVEEWVGEDARIWRGWQAEG